MTLMGIDFNNGLYGVIKEKPVRVKTAREVQDEDWKTAFAHDIKPIPSGVELVCEAYHNLYGVFLKTTYNGHVYYIEPRGCDYIDG